MFPLFCCAITTAQCTPTQLAKLLPDDGAVDDQFGNSVAISGTMAIVGADRNDDNGTNSGSAYLFDFTNGQQIAKLLPDDGAAYDSFGQQVAIFGTTAIVGAERNDDNGTDSGSAYLFDTTTGRQIAKLLPDDGAAGDRFGSSVAISDTTAIIGAGGDDDNGTNSGSAYLFDTTTGRQIAKLLPDDGAAGDRFWPVAISDTTAIVGAFRNDDNGTDSGSAYLFDTITGQQIAKLLPDDGAVDDQFGLRVAISGTTAIIGARGDDDNGTNSGSAYLFNIKTGQQIAKLLPDDGAADDSFGQQVAIIGTTAIVGAAWNDDNGEVSGSAYLFDTTTGQQLGKLLPDDGAAQDHFGLSVAIDGSTAIIGADGNDDNGQDSGSAYLFDISDCVTEPVVVTPNSFLLTRGTYVSGGIADLAASDNADLSIRRATSDVQSRTEFEVTAVSPTASPSSLEVTLEGAVFARSDVNQTIELYDHVAGIWEQVDTRTATRFTDSTVTVTATGDLSRFVEAGTLLTKARIRYQSVNPRQQFSSNTDQFVWTIGQ